MVSLVKETKIGNTYRQWIFALLANFTLFTYGMDCGWISPMTKILQSNESPTGQAITDNDLSWIASSLSIAAIFGVSIYTFISDYFGRKISVICIAVPQAISWTIRLCYPTTITLILSRVLSGLSAGGCFIIVPMYVKEISQDDIRGVLGTLVILLQTTGLLFMYIIGTYLSYYTVTVITLTISIAVTLFVLKAPESPAFLVKLEKYEEAAETVAYLRGLNKNDKIVQNVTDCMKSEETLFKSLPNISLASIFKNRSWRRGLFLITATFVFHGLNGSYVIVTYASTILISTGVKFEISPEIQTFSFPIFMIVGSLSLAAIVEKVGRKPLLIGSFLVTAICMALIVIMMILQERGVSIPSWLPVLAIILAVSMYGAGVSPIPYIIMTEMFSFQIRAKAMGMVVTFAWSLTSLLVISYTPLNNYIAPYAPFILYAVINFLGSIFTLLFIPETRAKTEEQINAILETGIIAKNSHK
ncbi:facilitated trehalose transporter Tret1-like [Danaus plexippus]|uniref:facilitated trehalose transporter Tret1-like n=1 Tax=Danaus plexippus TaxID=13037 RepID=UPI002AB1BF64|nr:facilitated trehalose transporter Tret1-like [Danaus plexippus]